ncbi:MAG: family 20 glycosylhydrolase, partial [Vibrio sp.]
MSIQLHFQVLAQKEDTSHVRIMLENHGAHTLLDWKLHFHLRYFIFAQSLVTVFPKAEVKLSQTGSYNCLQVFNTPLKQGDSIYFECEVEAGSLTQFDDAINEAFVEYQGQLLSVDLIEPQLLVDSAACENHSLKKDVNISDTQAAIIPKPNHVALNQGWFDPKNELIFHLNTQQATQAANWLKAELSQLTTRFDSQTALGGTIVFNQAKFGEDTNESEYQLEITPEHVEISSATSQGFLYACVSYLQLIEAHLAADYQKLMPCLSIQDKARFKHRGLMLDCARHFHSVEHIKRLLDQLCFYKINRFHWHLTDDEGWRIEIKA